LEPVHILHMLEWPQVRTSTLRMVSSAQQPVQVLGGPSQVARAPQMASLFSSTCQKSLRSRLAAV
jgi:hypothetical protein